MFYRTRRSAQHMALACEKVVRAERTMFDGTVERGWTIVYDEKRAKMQVTRAKSSFAVAEAAFESAGER